jgi:hypothetical protein
LELVVQRLGSVSIGGYEPDGSRATIVARTVSRRGWISEDGRRQAQQMIAAYEKKARR